MSINIQITAAGNTMAPCWVTLEAMGYSVSNKVEGNEETWYAVKEGIRLTATEPCQLLGLAGLIEARGENWRVSDDQIDSFLNQFYKAN
jgi:hypothetical protein